VSGSERHGSELTDMTRAPTRRRIDHAISSGGGPGTTRTTCSCGMPSAAY